MSKNKSTQQLVSDRHQADETKHRCAVETLDDLTSFPHASREFVSSIVRTSLATSARKAFCGVESNLYPTSGIKSMAVVRGRLQREAKSVELILGKMFINSVSRIFFCS